MVLSQCKFVSLVNVSASDQIATLFAAPLPSTAPAPIGTSITKPSASTANLCVAVPVLPPDP